MYHTPPYAPALCNLPNDQRLRCKLAQGLRLLHISNVPNRVDRAFAIKETNKVMACCRDGLNHCWKPGLTRSVQRLNNVALDKPEWIDLKIVPLQLEP